MSSEPRLRLIKGDKTLRFKYGEQAQYATITVLFTHPMESGMRIDQTSQKIVTENYIKRIELQSNGKLLMHLELSPFISKNPYFSFNIPLLNINDQLRMSYLDSNNKSKQWHLLVVKS